MLRQAQQNVLGNRCLSLPILLAERWGAQASWPHVSLLSSQPITSLNPQCHKSPSTVFFKFCKLKKNISLLNSSDVTHATGFPGAGEQSQSSDPLGAALVSLSRPLRLGWVGSARRQTRPARCRSNGEVTGPKLFSTASGGNYW